MILNFEREVDEILTLIEFEASPKVQLQLAMILIRVFDRGMVMERDHCVNIVQRLSVNAMDVVREIRKPRR